MSKVSALVSAYFAEQFLESRLANLYKANVDLQIVVVAQKGSKEADMAKGYKVELVLTPDIPPIGEAWNLAIENATGDYLITANTDDMFKDGGLAKMVKVLDDHPDIGLIFSQVDVFDGRGIMPWVRISNPTGKVSHVRDLIERRCVVGPMPLWRKSIHDEIGYFDETYVVAADYDMWLRMVRAGVKFWYIAESCGIYYRRADSLEWRNRALMVEENKAVRA